MAETAGHAAAGPTGPARLYAVRHGQSTANVAFAEPGRLAVDGSDAEVGLTALGRSQAAGLRGWVAREAPRLVVCSPYRRARETWREMRRDAPDAPEALVDERLRDRETGVFELVTPAGLLARSPEEAARRARLGEWSYRPPGGESAADVAVRVRDFLRDLAGVADGRRVLVVAHDAVVLALRYVIEGMGAPVPGPGAVVPNASVSTWAPDRRGRLRLVAFGVPADGDPGAGVLTPADGVLPARGDVDDAGA